MICYSCGENLPNEATHCYHCGAVMPTQETLESGGSDGRYFYDPRNDVLPFDDILEPRRKKTSLSLVLAVIAAVVLVGGGIYFATRTDRSDDLRAKLSQITFVNVTDTVPLVVTTPSQTAEVKVDASASIAPSQTAAALPTATAQSPKVISTFTAPSLPLYTGANVQVQAPAVVTPQTPAPAAEEVSGGESYTVVAGDSYWSIATHFYGQGTQTLVDMILSANKGKTIDSLKVGDVLTIPKLEASGAADDGPKADVRHAVVEGDNYWNLATKYYGKGTNALVDKIAAANSRTSTDPLKVGETITIPDVKAENSPEKPAVGTKQTYKVQESDSYWTVCNKFYGEADYSLARLIAEANNRTVDDALIAGETIVIPPRGS